jgi:hypothetical protein
MISEARVAFAQQLRNEDASLAWEAHARHERGTSWEVALRDVQVELGGARDWVPIGIEDRVEHFETVQSAWRWWLYMTSFTRDLAAGVKAGSADPATAQFLPDYANNVRVVEDGLKAGDVDIYQDCSELWQAWLAARGDETSPITSLTNINPFRFAYDYFVGQEA